MDEIPKEDLKIFLTSVEKDKSLGLDDWTMKLFLGFYDFIEEDLIRVVEESRCTWKVL